MRKIKLVLTILLFSSSVLNAQSIRGILVDAIDNKPLAGATLKLVSLKNHSIAFNTLSDVKGAFQFKNITVDSFMLNISFIGYEDFKQIIGANNTEVNRI